MMKRRTPSSRSSPSIPRGRAESPRSSHAAPRRRTRADREVAEYLLQILKAGGDARTTKIKRLRQKVRAKNYENELKLSVAIDKMLGEGALTHLDSRRG